MPATEKTFVEQDQVSLHKRDAQTVYRVTLTADRDFAELDISGASEIALDSLNAITADTLNVYFASSDDAAVRGTPGMAIAYGEITVSDYTTIVSEAAATGSITYGAPDAGDTVVVDGTTLTYVAAAPGAGEFSSIAELEVLVEAIAGINSSEDGTVVAITAASTGTAGNAITLALGGGNTGTMAVSGATLTGGAAGETITVDGTALVAGVDFTVETSNDVTAENINVAVDALADVTATRSSNVVTVEAAAAGSAGNAITLAEAATGVTISGATLSGGDDADEWGSNYVNSVGTNPFAAANDKVVGINVRGFVRLRVERVGASDGDVSFAVGIRN